MVELALQSRLKRCCSFYKWASTLSSFFIEADPNNVEMDCKCRLQSVTASYGFAGRPLLKVTFDKL